MVVVMAEGNLLRVAILVNNGATIVSELILLHVHGSEKDSLTIARLERISSALKACSEQLSEYYGRTDVTHLMPSDSFPSANA